MEIYFIRHFPTQSNIKQLWSGRNTNQSIDPIQTNKCLNDSLLQKIKNINFDFVFSSPLKRCLETCTLLGVKQKVTIDNRLIERDFGVLEQKPCNESIKHLLADWNLNTDLESNVEKIQDIYNNRLVPFITSIKKLPTNSKILIVSHSWIGRLLKYYFSRNENDIKEAPKNGELIRWCC